MSESNQTENIENKESSDSEMDDNEEEGSNEKNMTNSSDESSSNSSSESDSESSSDEINIIESPTLSRQVAASQLTTLPYIIDHNHYYAPNKMPVSNISSLKGRAAWNFINPSGINPNNPDESIFDFEINKELADNEEDRPWRKEGADITDWFNYGFTEETWEKYRKEMQKKIRNKQLNNKIQIFKIN